MAYETKRAVAGAAMTFRLPDDWSFEEGAAFVMNYHTSHFALHRRGKFIDLALVQQ